MAHLVTQHVIHQPLPVAEFMNKMEAIRIVAIREHNMDYLREKKGDMWLARTELIEKHSRLEQLVFTSVGLAFDGDKC